MPHLYVRLSEALEGFRENASGDLHRRIHADCLNHFDRGPGLGRIVQPDLVNIQTVSPDRLTNASSPPYCHTDPNRLDDAHIATAGRPAAERKE